MNPEIIPLLVAGVFCVTLLFVAWDSGLFAWARRGCPDYNEPPKPVRFTITQAASKSLLDAHDEAVDAECERILEQGRQLLEDLGHPGFQFGWPDRPDR